MHIFESEVFPQEKTGTGSSAAAAFWSWHLLEGYAPEWWLYRKQNCFHREKSRGSRARVGKVACASKSSGTPVLSRFPPWTIARVLRVWILACAAAIPDIFRQEDGRKFSGQGIHQPPSRGCC